MNMLSKKMHLFPVFLDVCNELPHYDSTILSNLYIYISIPWWLSPHRRAQAVSQHEDATKRGITVFGWSSFHRHNWGIHLTHPKHSQEYPFKNIQWNSIVLMVVLYPYYYIYYPTETFLCFLSLLWHIAGYIMYTYIIKL